jgi:hypothetical protein
MFRWHGTSLVFTLIAILTTTKPMTTIGDLYKRERTPMTKIIKTITKMTTMMRMKQ